MPARYNSHDNGLARPTHSERCDNRSYRALGRAYATVEGSASLQISDNERSSVTLTIGPDDALVTASLPIHLQDTEFSGTGRSSGTVIIPGSLTYGDEETLVLRP
jgi:hypothetical protein